MQRRASLSSAKREIEQITTHLKKLLNLKLDDEIAVDVGKAEMKALDARRKELQTQLETAHEPPPLLHPEMAALLRAQGSDAGSGHVHGDSPRFHRTPDVSADTRPD